MIAIAKPWLIHLAITIAFLLTLVGFLFVGEMAAEHVNWIMAAGAFKWCLNEIRSNKGVSMMISLAAIATMPPKIPYPFDQVPFLVWSWEWLVRLLTMAASMMRHPGIESSHSEKTQTPDGETKIVVDKSSASLPAEPAKAVPTI